MPKTRGRKKRTTRQKNTASTPVQQKSARSDTGSSATRRSAANPAARPENLVFIGLVTLGCWGLAISFIFFFPDKNHLLYGGMTACMAALYTCIFGLRVRKIVLQRRS